MCVSNFYCFITSKYAAAHTHTISKARFRAMPEAILPQGSSIVLLVIKASTAVVAIAASEELTVGFCTALPLLYSKHSPDVRGGLKSRRSRTVRT